MRRIILISYTEKGKQMNTRMSEYVTMQGDVAVPFHYGENFRETDEVLRQEWRRSSAFVFIGAMGIAVRHIACYIMDKLQDPAVLVADEKGQFVIPVLSGHIGGGVALARELAAGLGACPVITTGTDVEGLFAADVFAGANHLRVENRQQMRKISAALLRGQQVEFWSSLPTAGAVPAGMCLCPQEDSERAQLAVCVGPPRQGQTSLFDLYGIDNMCVFMTGRYIVGIGCKRGKTADELEAFLEEVCVRECIDQREIAAIASVDRKREESGIWELSRRLCVPYEVFSADRLMQVEEKVTSSAFVRQTLGTDNVCERSAYALAEEWTGRRHTLGLGKGREAETEKITPAEAEGFRISWEKADYRLAVEKQAGAGITLAVVEFVWE